MKKLAKQLKEAQDLKVQGQYDECVNKAKNIIKTDPDAPQFVVRAKSYLCHCHSKVGSYKKTFWMELCTIWPHHHHHHILLGKGYFLSVLIWTPVSSQWFSNKYLEFFFFWITTGEYFYKSYSAPECQITYDTACSNFIQTKQTGFNTDNFNESFPFPPNFLMDCCLDCRCFMISTALLWDELSIYLLLEQIIHKHDFSVSHL